MSSTYATVAVPAENLTEAQEQFPSFFTAAMSPTGEAPATHFVSSGYYLDTELDVLVNDVTWPRRVVFGDTQEALVKLGLMAVQDVIFEDTL